MKTKSKTNLKHKCDELWKKIIHLKGYCEVCNKPGQNAHHIIGRINYNLRWDLKNGCLLCTSCHKFSRNSAHNNPVYFINWFRVHRPEDYEYLQDKKFLAVKTWYISDYEEIYKKLKEEYERRKQI